MTIRHSAAIWGNEPRPSITQGGGRMYLPSAGH